MMAKRTDLTPEYVRSILEYNPQTGVLTWRHRSDRPRHWNTRYAGSVAGSPIKPNGYIGIIVDGRKYVAHVLAWLIVMGEWPSREIDHRDNDKANNRWGNLRPATHGQNNMNRGRRADNKSGFKGVFFDSQKRRWRAEICAHGVRTHLGFFDTPESGHLAYAEAAGKFHAEFARAA